jgi:hypothetical protein
VPERDIKNMTDRIRWPKQDKHDDAKDSREIEARIEEQRQNWRVRT